MLGHIKPTWFTHFCLIGEKEDLIFNKCCVFQYTHELGLGYTATPDCRSLTTLALIERLHTKRPKRTALIRTVFIAQNCWGEYSFAITHFHPQEATSFLPVAMYS